MPLGDPFSSGRSQIGDVPGFQQGIQWVPTCLLCGFLGSGCMHGTQRHGDFSLTPVRATSVLCPASRESNEPKNLEGATMNGSGATLGFALGRKSSRSPRELRENCGDAGWEEARDCWLAPFGQSLAPFISECLFRVSFYCKLWFQGANTAADSRWNTL